MKNFSSVSVFIMFCSIANVAQGVACPNHKDKECMLVWDGFNKDNSTINTSFIPTENLECNPNESVLWSSDGKTLTLNYLGKSTEKSKDGIFKSKTCYVKTDKILLDKNKQRINHGYITADISFQAEKNDGFIWPAFWLRSNPPEELGIRWPDSGEVDIAEHIFGGTYSNLIGDPKKTFEQGHKISLRWPSEAFIPDTKLHSYAMEWIFDPEKVELTYYYDNSKIGKQTASKSGTITEQNVYRAFENGWFEVILDSDRMHMEFVPPASGSGNWVAKPDKNPDRLHSITVSKLQVFQFGDDAAAQQPGTI